MLLKMKDFDFAQILITFAKISPKFHPNLTKSSPPPKLLGDTAVSSASTALLIRVVIRDVKNYTLQKYTEPDFW